jgi:polar amino acid transport system substrate-binding protein
LKIQNRIALILTFVIIMAVLAACSSNNTAEPSASTPDPSVSSGASPASADATGDLLSEIKKRGKLVVGTEAAFDPFDYIENGKIVGYDTDILNYIVKDLGVTLEQVDLPWQGVLPGLDAKRFDFVAASVTITPERTQKYLFTVPIADGSLAVLKRKDDTSIKTPDDLAGKVVGSQLGSAQMQGLQAFNETLKAKGAGAKELKEYTAFPEAFQDLANKRIDAVVHSLVNLSPIIKKQPAFEVVGKIGEQKWVSWALRKGDDSLNDYLSKIILEMKQNGKLAELQMKWFGFTMDLPDSGFLPQ